MWFRGQYVPVLSGRSKKSIFLSEDWVARGMTQRIGATVFAIVLLCGSILLVVGSFLLRTETSQDAGGILGQILGAMLGVLTLVVASFFVFLAFRLGRGTIRSFRK